MSLLWELFQEYQIGKQKSNHSSLDELVAQHEQDLMTLGELVGQMAQRIDELEAQVYGPGTTQEAV
jgi:hypothetical protein